jgi:hypothetical protein
MGSWSEADCEPLFNVRHLGQNPTAEDYRQREADAAFIVGARNHIPALLAALEAVLADHDNRGVFLAADDCDHPEPADDDAAWHDWDADHPPGLGDVGRICLLTETGRYCPACTRLVYDDDPLGDSYVDASNCIVRPAISAALLGSQKAPAGEETSHG